MTITGNIIITSVIGLFLRHRDSYLLGAEKSLAKHIVTNTVEKRPTRQNNM